MSKKFVLGLLFFFAATFTSQIWSQESVHATYYAKKFHNRKTSSGERYLKSAYTCAHKTLPFGTYLLVKNPDNGKEVIVKVNDRMSKRTKSGLDLSYAAADDLDIIRKGSGRLEISILDETALALKRNELLVSND
jgi:rare lipoprotein A